MGSESPEFAPGGPRPAGQAPPAGPDDATEAKLPISTASSCKPSSIITITTTAVVTGLRDYETGGAVLRPGGLAVSLRSYGRRGYQFVPRCFGLLRRPRGKTRRTTPVRPSSTRPCAAQFGLSPSQQEPGVGRRWRLPDTTWGDGAPSSRSPPAPPPPPPPSPARVSGVRDPVDVVRLPGAGEGECGSTKHRSTGVLHTRV